MFKFIGVIVAIIVVGAAVASSGHKKAAATPAGNGTTSACVFKATDSCTPHAGSNGRVRVDALIWKVRQSIRSTVPDSSSGLVGVDLSVRSDRGAEADLAGPQPDAPVSLKVGKYTYTPDDAANAAGDPLMGLTIQPGDTLKGSVEFDVPNALLNQPMELQFQELGFGTTKGYIALSNSKVQ